MKTINLIALLTIILFTVSYYILSTYFRTKTLEFGSTKILKSCKTNELNGTNGSSLLFIGTLAFTIIVRLICAYFYKGHESDMNCFIGWSHRIFEEGLSNFYSETTFSDYPPGYMYVLYVLGGIRKIFGLGFYSSGNIVLLKLPAITCDMITASILYKLAKRRMSDKIAVLCCLVYLLNPVIILNSALWGQVDSIFTLAVVLMCYYIYEHKLEFAYVSFAIGMLLKPQTIILTPVLILGIIDQVFIEEFTVKKFLHHLKYGVSAIILMFILMMPFGLTKVIGQYTSTLGSYPYASVNGYNIWTMLGQNWSSQSEKLLFLDYSQWGNLFILAVVMSAIYFHFKDREDDSKCFLIGAFIAIGMFVLSVRMHERYIYPALILLLISFVLRPSKKVFILYSLFSLLNFYNVSYVLFVYDVNNYNQKDRVPIIFGFITVLAFIYLLVFMVKRTVAKTNKHIFTNQKLKKFFNVEKKVIKSTFMHTTITKITKTDIVIMCIITIIYGVIALFDLGSKQAPESSWESNKSKDAIVLDFGEEKEITSIFYYLGNYENRQISAYISNNQDGPFDKISDFEMISVFSWGTSEIKASGRYLKIESNSIKLSLKELVIKDADNIKVLPVNNTDLRIASLFDEQELYPDRNTFRESTYFDEIYHARTAYEYLKGLYSYENTHPPLGKIFISLGMLIFGVNPFGWRIMGTIFGIAMVPLIYLFAKRIFKETWLSSIVCLLFTFDFMHFTQTRIATIDVFVTFFIILMYYYMYQYSQISFYDTKLSKSLKPLALSGIAMGFAIACKWTGIYAGLGLAITFFLILYKRYKEYRYIEKEPALITNGIEKENVKLRFFKCTKITILLCLVFFILIPIIIYTLSYLPFVDSQGNGLILRMLKNQETMFSYHAGVEATHPYSSWWYEWPMIIRPIWYYSGHISDTVSEGISAFGNPLVWWGGMIAFIYVLYRGIKEREEIALFLVIAYLAQYIPWFFVTRITFIYHYFPSTPFVVLMIGYVCEGIVKKHPKLKSICWVYTFAAMVLFLMFYPVLSGQAVSKQYVNIFLRWFKSWVLVS